MGAKRPHHHVSMPPESASRHSPNHAPKRRKPNDFAPPATKSASVNQLKSKIRDLTRALEHSDHLPAGVRIEKERALAGYKQDVEKIHEDKRKNELIKRYHMVRFFGGSVASSGENCLPSSDWDDSVLTTMIILKSARKPQESTKGSGNVLRPPHQIRPNTRSSKRRCMMRRSTLIIQSTTL